MNVLFVVAHPDDESLWVGGILNSLNKMPSINVHLICITGGNNETRHNEFKKVMEKINIKSFVVLEHDIPKVGGIFLNNLDQYFTQGLKQLNLSEKNIDLLVTHSPYGDEHQHVQHSQIFQYLYFYYLYHY